MPVLLTHRLFKVPTVLADASQAFVKLLGRSDDRILLSDSTIEEIKRAGCHWAESAILPPSDRGV